MVCSYKKKRVLTKKKATKNTITQEKEISHYFKYLTNSVKFIKYLINLKGNQRNEIITNNLNV